MKYIVINIETSGLKPEVNRLLEISGIVLDDKFVAKEKFDFYVKDDSGVINNEAMKINGIDIKDIMENGLDKSQIYDKFIELKNKYNVKRFVIIGWNVRFVEKFLRKYLGDMYNEIFLDINIDLIGSVILYIGKVMRLSDIVSELGIEVDKNKYRLASYRTKLCYKILRKLKKF